MLIIMCFAVCPKMNWLEKRKNIDGVNCLFESNMPFQQCERHCKNRKGGCVSFAYDTRREATQRGEHLERSGIAKNNFNAACGRPDKDFRCKMFTYAKKNCDGEDLSPYDVTSTHIFCIKSTLMQEGRIAFPLCTLVVFSNE